MAHAKRIGSLNCCLGEIKGKNDWLQLFASQGGWGDGELRLYNVEIYPNGQIDYYVDGHKIEYHENCEKLLEYFYSGLVDVIL